MQGKHNYSWQQLSGAVFDANGVIAQHSLTVQQNSVVIYILYINNTLYHAADTQYVILYLVVLHSVQTQTH